MDISVVDSYCFYPEPVICIFNFEFNFSHLVPSINLVEISLQHFSALLPLQCQVLRGAGALVLGWAGKLRVLFSLHIAGAMYIGKNLCLSLERECPKLLGSIDDVEGGWNGGMARVLSHCLSCISQHFPSMIPLFTGPKLHSCGPVSIHIYICPVFPSSVLHSLPAPHPPSIHSKCQHF